MLAFLIPAQAIETTNFRKAPERSEVELINLLLAGDTAALTKLYCGYSATLLGVISKIVKNEEAARDVLQETFIKIWKGLPQYDASKGRLFTWMSKLARNMAIDHLRSRGEINQLKNEDLDDYTFEVNERYQTQYHPEYIGLRKLMEALSPEQVAVLDLVYFQGYTQVEASEILQIPVSTAKTRLRAAIKTMRAFFR